LKKKNPQISAEFALKNDFRALREEILKSQLATEFANRANSVRGRDIGEWTNKRQHRYNRDHPVRGRDIGT